MEEAMDDGMDDMTSMAFGNEKELLREAETPNLLVDPIAIPDEEAGRTEVMGFESPAEAEDDAGEEAAPTVAKVPSEGVRACTTC